MKFPSWNKFKPQTPNEDDKIFPSWNELNSKIRKFEYKIDEKVKKLDSENALESAAEECFLVLPPPFDSLAEKIYDSSPGSAREKIKKAVAYFRQLQSGGALEYNHILTNLERIISVKDAEELQSRENLQKIYGVLIREEDKSKTKDESSYNEMEQKVSQPQSSDDNEATMTQDSRLEENKRDIVKSISKSGLPLVLRSEQAIIIQEEAKSEISLLLEENAKLMEQTTKPNVTPYDDEYLIRTGNFYYLVGNSEKSISHYDQVLQRNPLKMTALNNKGVVLDSAGAYDSAIECYDKALHAVPENVHVLCNKGIALYKNEKYQEALGCFEVALRFEANYVNALTFMGHTFYRLGKNNDALSCYNKVIRLEQNNAEALYNKACLCSLKGDEYGALASLERAIRLDPSWRESAINDKDLARVKNTQRFLELVQSSN